MWDKFFFCLAFLIAYTVQAVTGFAGNIFAMPVGTHLLGLSSSVAILNTMGVFACGLLGIINYKYVDWRQLAKICLVMLPFLALGIWLDSVIELRVLLRIYGAVIVAVGVYNLVKKKQRFLPAWGQYAIIAGAGLIQGMFVSGGALLVIYAVQAIPDKMRFRATLSMVWAVLNLIYAVFSFQQGYFTADVAQVVIVCIPLAVLATFLGSRIQRRVSQQVFLKICYVLLLLIGAVLLVTS